MFSEAGIAESALPLPRQYQRKFGLAFVIVAALFLALIAYQMYVSHRAAVESATTNAKNLVLILESKLNTDFEAAHSAVSAMALEIGPEAMRQASVSRHKTRIAQWLKSRLRNIPSASALRYFDAEGALLYSSVDHEEVFSIADRSFFQKLRANPAQSLIYSEVIAGRSTGRVSVVVEKSIRDKDGVFLGVATTAIDLKALHDEFSHIALGKDGAVVLRRMEDGAVVVRFPGPVDVDNAPSPNLPVRQALIKNGANGAIAFLSPVDGVRRIYGYRRVGNFPFFVAVGIADAAYLAEWRGNLLSTSLTSALFLAILVAVLLRLAHAESQRDRTAMENRRYALRLQGIILAIPEGLIFQNKAGGVIDANPAAEQLLGFRQDTLCGASPWRRLFREDGTHLPVYLHPAMVALATGQFVRNQIVGMDDPERGRRWFDVNSNPILGEGKRSPDTVVTTFSDITERKQSEIELRIAAIAFESQDGMMVTDTQGVILRVNRAFTESTGYTAAEAVGHTPRMLRSNHHEPEFFRAMWRSVISTGAWQGEVWDRRKGGEVYPKWLTISAVKDNKGVVTHFIGTHSDMTERKRSEAAMLLLNQALSVSRQQLREMSAQVDARREDERKHIAQEVHDELGQVLTALRMDISLVGMRFGALDPAVNGKVLDMKRMVDRAIQGVRNVVVNLRPTALDMGLVPAITWLCREFTRKTGIACVFDAGVDDIEMGEDRAVVIFRIVQESLTNVTRYANASLVEISLGVRDQELGLEVRDNGCGFDLAVASGKKSFGLLGMHERALALGGHVDVISALGQGTVIGVSIPVNVNTSKEST